MKIAGYIHPVPQALGPNFACGWFEIVAKLLQTLRRDANCDCMMIAGSWPFRWASEKGLGPLLEGIRSAEIDEIALYRTLSALGELPTALDQAAYISAQRDNPALEAITDEVARAACGFEPDVVISFGIQIDFLAALWPNAPPLHIESGPFSRNPYPFSLFFDHLGMYGRSVVGQAGNQLRARPTTADSLAVANAFRIRNALALDTVDPFRTLDLRAKFDRLVLLPLQVSNYYSFDEQTSYRTQFEYLLDVLSACPPDVGVIATEYLEWGHVLRSCGSGQNISYLQRNFPQLIFLEEFRSYCSPSQFLVPRVDGVWSVSSNVAYQALLHNRVLGSPATSHFGHLAHATTLNSFFDSFGQSSDCNDALMAWLLEHYFVPEALLSDGRWLRDYFARRIASIGSSTDPIDEFVPIADAEQLIDCWIVKAPKPTAVRFTQPLDEALAEARLARADARAARQMLDAVSQSTSWRMTAPLRTLSRLVPAGCELISSLLPPRSRHHPTDAGQLSRSR